MKKEKGQASAGVITLMIMSIMIIVTGIIFSEMDEVADGLALTTAGQASIDNITNNGYSSLNVVSVAPIVAAAAVVLAIVAMLKAR